MKKLLTVLFVLVFWSMSVFAAGAKLVESIPYEVGDSYGKGEIVEVNYDKYDSKRLNSITVEYENYYEIITYVYGEYGDRFEVLEHSYLGKNFFEQGGGF